MALRALFPRTRESGVARPFPLASLFPSSAQGRHQSDRNINSRPCEILSGQR